jgi:hypothetical protein
MACGDLVTSTRQVEKQVTLSVRQSHSQQFKDAVRGYVKAYNQQNGTKVSVAFPAPFAIRLRE